MANTSSMGPILRKFDRNTTLIKKEIDKMKSPAYKEWLKRLYLVRLKVEDEEALIIQNEFIRRRRCVNTISNAIYDAFVRTDDTDGIVFYKGFSEDKVILDYATDELFSCVMQREIAHYSLNHYQHMKQIKNPSKEDIAKFILNVDQAANIIAKDCEPYANTVAILPTGDEKRGSIYVKFSQDKEFLNKLRKYGYVDFTSKFKDK